MKQFLVIVIVAIVLIGLVFWAFRSPTKTSPSPTPTPAANKQNPFDKNVIKIENSGFNPAEITIKSGDPVNFSNQDNQIHNVTFAEFNTGDIKPGSSVIHAFNKAGVFEYHCQIHPSEKGKVIVQ